MNGSIAITRKGQGKRFAETRFDVLVIGGGIVGAGIARDAAMRGLATGLIEQYDLAFGTSSRSSRLIHGGLRYLAQGRIRLVRQAGIEKQTLHRIAPHLCQPLAFVFPSYRGGQWPHWKLRAGVRIYDLLCGGKNFGASRGMTAAETLCHVPMLRGEGLEGSVRYFDALTQDARLVIDTIRSAAGHGAVVANYARFEGAVRKEGGWVCDAADAMGGGRWKIETAAVVNAAGPWADQLPRSSVRLRPTKGIHLVIERTRLPVPDAVVMTDADRILFAIPWGERVILGTTDTDYRGPVEAVRAEPADVEYVLGIANRFFPEAGLSALDVRGTWAGLRPLIADPSGKPSDISRSHRIHSPEPGWWDVAGGKLTTFRLMAEETVDQIVRALGRSCPPCRTANERLLPPEDTDGISGIIPPPFSRAVVEHCCRKEWAVHLDDVMIRRTGWHYSGGANAEEVASWMAEIFGWSREEREQEILRASG